jgi:hypothetical protein
MPVFPVFLFFSWVYEVCKNTENNIFEYIYTWNVFSPVFMLYW